MPWMLGKDVAAAMEIGNNNRQALTCLDDDEKGNSVKISISYLPEEEKEATAALAALRRLHSDGKVRKSDRHPLYLHIYFTTKRGNGKTGNNPLTIWPDYGKISL